MKQVDVIIIGASASGLMCAIEAGKRGRTTLVLDHANKAGKKILMSGGGRCNFTNMDVNANNYISHNPHFCKSALSRYTQWDFISLVQAHGISYHEREHGQLFCNISAKDILNMLLEECAQASADVCLKTEINSITQHNQLFTLQTSKGEYHCQSLVIASGGLSIPTLGSSPFGYKIAEQFDIKVWPVSAGLVPFTLQPKDKQRFVALSGIAVDSLVSTGDISFRENILFTHRGLSGPAILQISSYWQPGKPVSINLLPDINLYETLIELQQSHPLQQLKSVLSRYLPKRLVAAMLTHDLSGTPLQQLSQIQLSGISKTIQQWQLIPGGTEGYRTAEVTLGGVDCNALSSKTMQSTAISGLFFIGEVVDITGWLGGYNFQWAWSSGWCAGQYV